VTGLDFTSFFAVHLLRVRGEPQSASVLVSRPGRIASLWSKPVAGGCVLNRTWQHAENREFDLPKTVRPTLPRPGRGGRPLREYDRITVPSLLRARGGRVRDRPFKDRATSCWPRSLQFRNLFSFVPEFHHRVV